MAMSDGNQCIHDLAAEEEQIMELAKECIKQIDASGGVCCHPAGIRRVAETILRIVGQVEGTEEPE